jgi:transcriptional repressor NrdR
VVKKDNRREAFDQQKILSGVEAACGKRPISEDAKLRLVQEVEDELHREFDREVPTSEVGKRVAMKLRNLDHIAYIRYASEYYAFRSLEDFNKELADLQNRSIDLPNQTRLFPGN